MSLYRADSLRITAKCNFHLVSVQEVRRVEDGNETAYDFTFFYGSGNPKAKFSVRKGIISPFKMIEFISDRVSYITLRDHSLV
jgi:hypothetical protein